MQTPLAIIFDIGNVIVRFDYQLALNGLSGQSEKSPHDVKAALEDLKELYEQGGMDRATFLSAVRKEIHYRGSDADLERIWKEIFTINEPMATLVKALHGRYPLYLLSNTSDLHIEYVTTEYPIFVHFKDGVYSHEAKMTKPNPAIFKHATDRFGVDPARTIYIDDLKANIDAALAHGLVAIHYDPDAHSAFEKRLRSLRVDWDA